MLRNYVFCARGAIKEASPSVNGWFISC